MRYESVEDIPETLQDVLPEEAQQIYLEVYQEAWDDYTEGEGGELSRDGVAHRQAMHAVRQEFVQSKDGQWYRRGEEPEVNEDEGEEKDAF
jgi:cation transport regulator